MAARMALLEPTHTARALEQVTALYLLHAFRYRLAPRRSPPVIINHVESVHRPHMGPISGAYLVRKVYVLCAWEFFDGHREFVHIQRW